MTARNCYGCRFGNLCRVRAGLEEAFRYGFTRRPSGEIMAIYETVADLCEMFDPFPDDEDA